MARFVIALRGGAAEPAPLLFSCQSGRSDEHSSHDGFGQLAAEASTPQYLPSVNIHRGHQAVEDLRAHGAFEALQLREAPRLEVETMGCGDDWSSIRRRSSNWSRRWFWRSRAVSNPRA
jgi:hypothetical protein